MPDCIFDPFEKQLRPIGTFSVRDDQKLPQLGYVNIYQ